VQIFPGARQFQRTFDCTLLHIASPASHAS
jgi:hypothetical protein